MEGSGNEGWRLEAFRAYADHALTEEFARGLAQLEALAVEAPTAYMCAEHTHLRCHRRIVSDWLKARGWDVEHILADGRLEPHAFTGFARVVGGRVTYPAEAASG